MRRLVPWFISIPAAALLVISLPAVQTAFIPMPGEMQRLVAESRQKPPAEPVVFSDVVYRRSVFARLKLDIYEPLVPFTRGEAPVVVFFHGGSWIHGDRVTILVVDRFLRRMREAGYFVIPVDYTTTILRGLQGPLDNVESAIRWIAANAGEYGYDRNNLGLYGVSAGGHLALMAASTMPHPDFTFAFVFAECAPSDLVALRSGEAFEHSASLAVFPERRLAQLSPVNFVSPQLPPVLLFHGGADQVVDVRQSERYARVVADAGIHVEYVRYENGDHGFLNLPDDTWYEQETRALVFFHEQFTRRTPSD